MTWSINSQESILRRTRILVECHNDPTAQGIQMAMCANNMVYFINTFGITYDPRLVTQGLPAYVPFDLFPRQEDLIRWVQARIDAAEEGLLEKSRGYGFTWLAAAVAVNKWLFQPGFLTSFGSRKEELVDKIGDTKSIFEKIRMFRDRLPMWMMPEGWSRDKYDNHCKIVNPANGNTITGEAGENMGRGGRSTLYAQPLDSKIITPTGQVSIGDLKVGDELCSVDGGVAWITAIKDHGMKPVFKVILSDGASTECCDEHLWEVIMPRNGGVKMVMPLGEIRKKLAYEGETYCHYRYRIPMPAPVFLGDRSPPVDPYLMGVMIGDGAFPESNSSVRLCLPEPEMLALVAERLPPGFNLVPCDDRGSYRLSYRKGTGEHLVLDELRRVGLNGHRSYEKFIPHDYLHAPIDDRLDLLRGLMDTDGCTCDGMNTFITTSTRLVEDVSFLVRSLGGSVHVYEKPGGREVVWKTGKTSIARMSWHVNMKLPEGMTPFLLPRKASKFKYREPKHQIVEVIPLGEKPVRCIQVSDDAHLYLTDDFIITHNCLDEAAFIERAETVEAAVSDNADVRIWASTVNGPGNTFSKKRHDGLLRPDQIFTAHWRDDPRRTEEWARKRKLELASTPWVWASEYDIDYTAAVEDICIPAPWVDAAVVLGTRLDIEILSRIRSQCAGTAGFDIGDGVARSVFQPRFGPLIVPCTSWIRADTTTTAWRGVRLARELGLATVYYDKVGVGKGVLSTLSMNKMEGHEELRDLRVIGVNVGMPAAWQTTWPDGQSSRRKFANAKAELWMLARERFHNSFDHLRFLNDEPGGVERDLEECFVFEPAVPLAEEGYRSPYRELVVQLSTPKKLINSAGKEIMESKAQLHTRGVASPDFAEALVLSLYTDYLGAPTRAVEPATVPMQKGFPELDGTAVMTDYHGTFDPATRTGTKFDSHFSRDW